MLSKMKKLLLLLPLTLFSVPTEVKAQYQGPACVDIRQVNVPGWYDQFGNYYPPTTRPIQTTVPCNYGISNYNYQYYQGNRNYQQNCNPNAGAAVGAGLAEALSGGTGWNYNSNWSNTRTRNSSSGSYNYGWQSRKGNGWTIFGAGLGSLMFSC
jgi:hypothetical protein